MSHISPRTKAFATVERLRADLLAGAADEAASLPRRHFQRTAGIILKTLGAADPYAP